MKSLISTSPTLFKWIFLISLSTVISCGDDEKDSVDASNQFDCAKNQIIQNTTWDDVVPGNGVDYRISCEILVSGSAVLTIAPGVIIEFEGAESGIFVSENAGLSAVGNAANPIKFMGKGGKSGTWQGIYFGSNNPINKLDYVTIMHAGATASTTTKEKSGLQLNQGANSRASITNSTISGNEGYGVYISEKSNLAEFTGNTISDNSLSPVAIPFTLAGKLNASTSYGTGNGQNYIQVISEDLLNSDLSLEKLTIPYRFSGNKIFITRALTIKPGAVLEFNTGTGLRLGTQASDQLDRTGSINATGTAAEPIVFRGTVAGQGTWLGIGINSASSNNKFIFCNISGGGASQMFNGGGRGNIVLTNSGTTATINNSTIKDSGGWGIHKGYETVYKINISESNNTYSNNALGNVSP